MDTKTQFTPHISVYRWRCTSSIVPDSLFNYHINLPLLCPFLPTVSPFLYPTPLPASIPVVCSVSTTVFFLYRPRFSGLLSSTFASSDVV